MNNNEQEDTIRRVFKETSDDIFNIRGVSDVKVGWENRQWFIQVETLKKPNEEERLKRIAVDVDLILDKYHLPPDSYRIKQVEKLVFLRTNSY